MSIGTVSLKFKIFLKKKVISNLKTTRATYCVDIPYKCMCYLSENRQDVHIQMQTFKAASKDGDCNQVTLKC